MSVIELEQITRTAPQTNSRNGNFGAESDLTITVDPDDGIEVIDPAARNNYQRRLRELYDERLMATANDDRASINKIDEETAQIEQELNRSLDKSGKPRSVQSSNEKARQRVRRAIEAAWEKIGKHDPKLEKHLRKCIKTGFRCSYSPDPDESVDWILE